MATSDQRIYINDINTLRNVACNSDVYVGAAVYIQANNKVANAQANSLVTTRAIGFCVAKPTSILADIKTDGFTDEIFSGLDDQKMYYLSPTIAGGLTDVAPATTGHFCLPMGRPITDKKMIIKIGTLLKRS